MGIHEEKKISDAMVDILRQKTGAERLQIAFDMWTFARDTIRRNLQQEHPEWTDEEINIKTAERLSHGSS